MSTSALQRTTPNATAPMPWRLLWRVLAATGALLLAYGAWAGYQNPDLLLNIASAFRLC